MHILICSLALEIFIEVGKLKAVFQNNANLVCFFKSVI